MLAASVLAGCGAGGGSGGVAAPVPTGIPTMSASAPRPAATRPAPPPASSIPAPVDAPCPYADARTVSDTVGQHIARTTLTRTTPYPACAYYRPNGEVAVVVAVSEADTPRRAQQRALSIGGAAANPVEGIGDGGSVLVAGDTATLAVSKGRAVVKVVINQASSLEAREMAKLVVARVRG